MTPKKHQHIHFDEEERDNTNQDQIKSLIQDKIIMNFEKNTCYEFYKYDPHNI